MKNKIAILVAVICVGIIMSYLYNKRRVPSDPFYEFGGWRGDMYIPLIKPFNVFSYDGKNWMVGGNGYSDYYTDEGECSIDYVKRFQGSDSLFLFSYNNYLGVLIKGEMLSEGWLIISIKHKIYKGFTDYEEFRDAVFSGFQITVDTSTWRTPNSYYREFKKEGTLPWFPDSIWESSPKPLKHP